ncbi:TetR/AcrR family transcriptional regulator [Nitratireductor mangrovi]|uniref:TetR/AcrR family transcriptional regulator n=2 Tax=Nitratireductor mangrovi TaxID=2599600 RepID=A0A5B8KXK4_9HYPH|nr:TetR/AcrR family transcriptional regulator [Nitratireductor mangrovi]
MSITSDRNEPSIRPRGAAASRLTEREWIDAAFRHIAKANFDDIRVEELAREMGVTKGSFYWHFRNRQHLVERVLEHWMDRATIQVTRWARSEEEGGLERLERLLSLPANTPPDKRGAEIELAVRSWARREKLAADTVRKVDEVRADFFRELMADLGLDGEEAAKRAAIAQSFMLGEALLQTGRTKAERLATVRACAEMIAAPARP